MYSHTLPISPNHYVLAYNAVLMAGIPRFYYISKYVTNSRLIKIAASFFFFLF